ncbi:MAG: hypothetical protein ABI234_05425, partial [Ktedonobacteraceae bacterium]
TTDGKLKPSGARPWSRTRASSTEGMTGQMNMAMMNANAAPGFDPNMNNGYAQQGFDPNMQNRYPQQGFNQNMQNGYAQQSFDPNMQNGYPQQGFDPNMHNGYAQQGFDPNTQNRYPQQGFNPNMQNGYAQQGMNGYGQAPGGFSDSFVPPSSRIFSQSDASMILPNTGALAAFGNGNGYAPNSNAFNAMYGLPDDPFASSQGGGPGWLGNLGNGQNSSGQQRPAPNNFAPNEPNMNDPYLTEVIRQYSQKGQAVHPPQLPQSPQPERRPDVPNPNSEWIR